ncbi:small secreted [Pyrrhoderma noxium]|uniref:Small secreted n=1 Tax=Pyrrhoderma noxium TaxID=2282107 RepID=A0A286UI49_9AGAM|nr:small secreted [Pyrrhoderma noxium]
MTRFGFLSFVFLTAIVSNVGAAPIRMKRAVTQTAANFKELAYADFQISDGVAGNAEAEANAVFVDPFSGTDLSTVSSDVLDALKSMREAAEDAETAQFNPAIAAASGAEADALQVGKIKNKVLKLTGEVQVLNIQVAQAKASGDDTSDLESKLQEEQTKLSKNIATDVASAGQASEGVTGGSSASSASASAADSATSASVASATTTSSAAAATASDDTSSNDAVTQTAANFKELAYADFQISDGVAGNAEAEANAVFVDPFAGTDLSTVSSDVLEAVKNMREAAEDAETAQFNPAIAAASGAEADALQVGKIKNKVLKLTGEVQAINIQIAQAKASGDDTSDLEDKLSEEQTKLTKNIATDKASAGDASKGVA